MKDIHLREAISFQDCFIHDNEISPFEFIEDYKLFYPMAILGEIGSIINLCCKKIRSPHPYQAQVKDEITDVFIYLLLFGKTIGYKKQIDVFGETEKIWEEQPQIIKSEEEFVMKITALVNRIMLLLSKDKERHHTGRFFSGIVMLIKEINLYLTKDSWQESVNNFHTEVIDEFTQINKYTPDLWYRGSCYVNFEKLIAFIRRNQLEIPEKRMYFLERMSALQNTRI